MKQISNTHINDWNFNTVHKTNSINVYDIIIVGIIIYLIYYILF